MKVKNDIKIDGKRLLNHLVEELNSLAGVPVAITLKDDRIDGNANMIEAELVDVLDIRRRCKGSELRNGLDPAFREPAADGNAMLQVLNALPCGGVALRAGQCGRCEDKCHRYE
jgi:hypothetical protein